MFKRLLILSLMLLMIVGCATTTTQQVSSEPVVQEQPISELIGEIHDLDTESTVSYSDFNNGLTKFQESYEKSITVEDAKTVYQYANSTKMKAAVAKRDIENLLQKIDEAKKRNLSSSQKDYVTKLELASENFDQQISVALKLIDEKLIFNEYSVHNYQFFENYNEILEQDAMLAVHIEQENWNAVKNELQSMKDSTNMAQAELTIFRAVIPFQSFSHYDEFIALMQEYILKMEANVAKLEKNKMPTQSEINAAADAGFAAGRIFEADEDGAMWADGEYDEVESYKREHIYSYEDEITQLSSKATAYYDDAKLRYESLIRETS